jgi:subtilase-type serine protease
VLAGITLASGAFALMMAANPQNAVAACAVTLPPNTVTNTVTCGTTTTIDQTFPMPPMDRDRAYVFPFSTDDLRSVPPGNVTGNITSGATVDGFGLAIVNNSRGAADINFTNAGTITLTAGVPTVGGTAALSLLSFGGNITYSGNGNVSSGSFNTDAIDLVTTGGNGSISFRSNGVINATNTGILATNDGTGGINIVTGGTVNASTGISASAIGDIFVGNNGTVNATGAAIFAETSGNITVSNSGLLTGAMSLFGATNTFNNNGTWDATGNSSFASPSTLNNNGNGVINISGPADISLFGSGSIFNNSGTINAVSSPNGSPIITAATFNNSGLINLATGTGTNQLTLIGNFVGLPGSTLDVSVGPANSRTDQLIIQGSASGTTTLNAFGLSNQFIKNPIPVVTVTGNSSATFSLSNPRPFNGLLIFGVNQTSP